MISADGVSVTTVVAVAPEVAFRVFTEEIDAWWGRGPRFQAERSARPTGGGCMSAEIRTPGATFDIVDTYVHLEDGPGAVPLEVGDDFWEKIGSRQDLGDGRLVCAFHFTEDWPGWEVHPAGDEIVYLLSGSLDLVLEEEAGERIVPLRGRAACIVPRGVWHRAIVHEPSDALHITRGAGTKHRPL